jgi:hypothetical protein
MKTLLFILLLTLCACGKEPLGLSNSKWVELDYGRKWEFETVTMKDWRRDKPNGDWELIGTYRWELKEDVLTFTKENNEQVTAIIQFKGDDEFRVLKYGGVVSWIPATYRRAPYL